MSPVLLKQPTNPDDEIIIAEHQDEYQNLPAVITHHGNVILSRWQLTDEELAEVIKTKSVFVYVVTFGLMLQPLLLSVHEDEILELPK